MSSPKFREFNHFDQYLGRWFKNLIQRYQPPVGSRRRLIDAAANRRFHVARRHWYSLRPAAFVVDELPDLYNSMLVGAIEGYWRNRTLPAHSI